MAQMYTKVYILKGQWSHGSFFFSDSVQTTPPYSDCAVTYKQLKDLMFNVYTVHVCAKFIIYVNIIVTFAEPTCNYKCNYIVTLLLKLCNVI